MNIYVKTSMRTSEFSECSQGYISGKMESMLKNRPGSDNVGYDLKIAKMPCNRKVAKRGSCLIENVSRLVNLRAKNTHWNFIQMGAT